MDIQNVSLKFKIRWKYFGGLAVSVIGTVPKGNVRECLVVQAVPLGVCFTANF